MTAYAYFFRQQDKAGDAVQLWRTDGTAVGTTLVQTLGTDWGGYADATRIYSIGNRIIASAYDRAYGFEWWSSDGTSAGTALLGDLTPGVGNSGITGVSSSGNFYFSGAVSGVTQSIFRTDGTPAGTTVYEKITTRFATSPAYFELAGTHVMISSYPEGYISDTGYAIGVDHSQLYTSPGLNGQRFVEFGYPNNDLVYQYELWLTDGTAAGSRQVFCAVCARLGPFRRLDCERKRLFWAAPVLDAHDHTTGGQVYSVDQAGHVVQATSFNATGGQDTAVNNGFYQLNGNTIFLSLTQGAADNEHAQYQLWKIDAAGSVSKLADFTGVRDPYDGEPYGFSVVGDVLYFIDPVAGGGGWSLMRTDGTSAGTRVVQILSGLGAPNSLTALGDKLLFSAGGTLFISDGTNAGTHSIGAAAKNVVDQFIPPSSTHGFVVLDLATEQTGSSGNDTLRASSQNDRIDGAAGRDTVIFVGKHSDWTIAATSDGGIQMTRGAELDVVRNVERLHFDDGVTLLDIGTSPTDPQAAQAFRLYQAAFARSPDEGGLRVQVGALKSGVSLQQLAANFIASNEFITVYGTNVDNDAFAQNLYRNVLARAPDAGGLKVQIDALNGGLSRAQLLANFSESAENVSLTGAATKLGLFSTYPDPAFG